MNVLRRDAPGYEAARRDCVWNARIADRFPDVIVQAEREEDVVAAITLARDGDMKIGVRSGGHSWAGSHLRDGGLLLDVSRLTDHTLDAGAQSATVQPGVRGSVLAQALRAHDLFFPVGHCQGVAMGGYLLQGGFGWLSRVFGPACANVTAIDVVTAEGELVRADEQNHADLLWAARGAGPGFFGVVTRFHLRLHAWPRVAMNSIHLYPVELLDEIFTWARQIGPTVARTMEVMIFLQRPQPDQRVIAVTGPVLADSDDEAREALAILESCPVRERASAAPSNVALDFADLVAAGALLFPDGNRFAADNMWTSAAAADLLPGLHRIADTLPPEPSHAMWMNWGPSPERPDMAYSVEDEVYIALYASWTDPGNDEHARWPGDRMLEMQDLATGIQLADENLGARPARFVSDEHLRRLDEIRARYDPEGRFHSWMGRP